MVRSAVLIGAVLLLTACQQSSPSDAITPDYNARLNHLEGRVAELEHKSNAWEAELDARPRQSESTQDAKAAAALLTGSTMQGEPINIEYSTMPRCLAARDALIAQGERACAKQAEGSNGIRPVVVNCSRPQASCSLR
ncbi:MAG: hypothetical protein ABIT04_08425 [Novosphingobium sp.]